VPSLGPHTGKDGQGRKVAKLKKRTTDQDCQVLHMGRAKPARQDTDYENEARIAVFRSDAEPLQAGSDWFSCQP